jgi:hypothetical protein
MLGAAANDARQRGEDRMNIAALTGTRWLLTRRAVMLAGGAAMIAGIVVTGQAATPDQAPPLPSSQARVWFLRQLVPGMAMHAPMIYANGQPLAIIPQGVAFYRDVAPGTYSFAIQSCLPAEQTSVTLPLGAGNEFALQVVASDYGGFSCESGENMSLAPAPADSLGQLFAPLAYLGAR